MDIIDASDYDFLLSRRTRSVIGLALIVGIAFVPPVKRWYLGQIEDHAQHVVNEFMSQFTNPEELAPQEPNQDSTKHR